MLTSNSLTRRTFLASASTAALAHGASSNQTLKAGLVGCGGRGTQAVVNLLTGAENVELVAVADVFEDALESSLNKLRTDAKYVSRDAGIIRRPSLIT
jgi:myo-inositol 2-dehydrogenase/D-chiro-inositol 1-dehydrogenase